MMEERCAPYCDLNKAIANRAPPTISREEQHFFEKQKISSSPIHVHTTPSSCDVDTRSPLHPSSLENKQTLPSLLCIYMSNLIYLSKPLFSPPFFFHFSLIIIIFNSNQQQWKQERWNIFCSRIQSLPNGKRSKIISLSLSWIIVWLLLFVCLSFVKAALQSLNSGSFLQSCLQNKNFNPLNFFFKRRGPNFTKTINKLNKKRCTCHPPFHSNLNRVPGR